MVEIVFDGSIRATLDQKLHHRHVSRLNGHVECSNALTVSQSTEGTFLIDVGAVIQQPGGCLGAVVGAIVIPEPESDHAFLVAGASTLPEYPSLRA